MLKDKGSELMKKLTDRPEALIVLFFRSMGMGIILYTLISMVFFSITRHEIDMFSDIVLVAMGSGMLLMSNIWRNL